jgi:uncharacterized FAD-dependent dehydrogenase
VNVGKLYPIGEGSGYTGGITSSAIDAIKAVERSTNTSEKRDCTTNREIKKST